MIIYHPLAAARHMLGEIITGIKGKTKAKA